MIQHLLDRIQGKAPPGAKRARGWRAFRSAHLKANPTCAVCGSRRTLEAHHVIPFHLAPDLELNPKNLLTLCRRCHLILGHLGAWDRVNLTIAADAAYLHSKIEEARG